MSLFFLVVKRGVRISFVHVASRRSGEKQSRKIRAQLSLAVSVAPGLSESVPFIYPAIGKGSRFETPAELYLNINYRQREDRAAEIDARPLAVGRGRVQRG